MIISGVEAEISFYEDEKRALAADDEFFYTTQDFSTHGNRSSVSVVEAEEPWKVVNLHTPL